MFTQTSVNLFASEGTKFRNSRDGLNVNWGMYTVADINQLLFWHIEHSPETRKQAKHIRRWLNYHATELSWHFYEVGFGKDDYTTNAPEPITRTMIDNARVKGFHGARVKGFHDDTKFEVHYCKTTCYWLNRALNFLTAHPTPIR